MAPRGGALNGRSSRRLPARSQAITVPSSLALNAVLPSGAIATPDTVPACPANVSIRCASTTFQRITRPSVLAVMSVRESGVKRRSVTGPSWRSAATRRLPVCRSSRRTEPSAAPNATTRPSGLSADGEPPPRRRCSGRRLAVSRMTVARSAALEVTSRAPCAVKPTSSGSGVPATCRGGPSRRPVRASQRMMSVLRRRPLRVASAASTRESGEKAIVSSANGTFTFAAVPDGGPTTRCVSRWCVRPSRMSTDPPYATAKRVPSGLNLTAEIAVA